MLRNIFKDTYYRYLLLSISGLSFWFFLGFPFANYHESYEWIAQIRTMPEYDLIFSYVGHYASYRPLGQFLALLLYKIFSHSMTAIQIFNYLVSIIAILFILKPNSEKTLPLSITFFLIGSIFFPAFSYLFHLHGFFYSPLALLLALLYYFSLHEFSFNTILKTFYITFIAALFHPFAIIIYFAFLAGWSVENRNSITQKIVVLFAVQLSSLIILTYILVKEPLSYLTLENLAGIYDVFSSLDAKLPMLLLSFLLAIITVYSVNIEPKIRKVLLSLTVLLSVLFVFFKIPLIFLLILSCLAKLIHRKNWSLVFLILALILFPLFAGTISKHLKFLILFILPIAITLDMGLSHHKIQHLNGKIITAVPAALCIILILLKFNLQLPVISRIAYPLLAEQEKSFQLEKAMDWILHSQYKSHPIEFYESGDNDKFPASNTNVNAYLEITNSKEPYESQKLFICFDCDSLITNKILYSAEGKYSTKITVFLP